MLIRRTKCRYDWIFFILLLYNKNRCRIDEILFVQHENVESPENFVFLILWFFLVCSIFTAEIIEICLVIWLFLFPALK